jgi:toxin ParE1/3/4
MKPVLLAEARAEFDDAIDRYAKHASPLIAEKFIAEFEHAMQLVVEHPQLGTPISQNARALMFRGFPYKLIYRTAPDTLFIVAVAHQRRRPGYWGKRR